MPDWSYRTLFRPPLFSLPPRIARGVTLQAMGRLSRLPGGALVIRTLGHMEPSPLLEREAAGLEFATPVGLSGRVDPSGTAQRALSQFGFGFIEIGPVTVLPVRCVEPIRLEREREEIYYPNRWENEGLDAVAKRIARPGHATAQFARISPMPGASAERALEELERLMEVLSEAGASGFYVDVLSGGLLQHDEERQTDAKDSVSGQCELKSLIYAMAQIAEQKSLRLSGRPMPLFLYVHADYPDERLRPLIPLLREAAWAGIVLGEELLTAESAASLDSVAAVEESERSVRGTGALAGGRSKAALLGKIRLIRQLEREPLVLKAAGVHEPKDALDLMQAGADLVLVGSGLVFAGPGLPKRINEAVVYETVRNAPEPKVPSFWQHWGWMCLLGIGMILGGILAWLVAATTVLLPYDETFLGMTAGQIQRINGHLLHFMSHDRITLAGTMISIGLLYFQIARHGLREGLHWSKTALLVSGLVGFSSFFLYLGYGYFDPLHALAAAILLPMFVLSMRSNPDRPYRRPVYLTNDRLWRRAMWGQLCFVALGFALAFGGATIAGVGITSVFVPQDLDFLGASPDVLAAANPKLIPLIAHDRAGFGGALFSNALALLIMALWGLQWGERWQWYTLLLGGAPGFIAGFGVHISIGYTDFIHLLPAFVAFALYAAGLVLLYPYLMSKTERSGSSV